jgi:hypothetical protein
MTQTNVSYTVKNWDRRKWHDSIVPGDGGARVYRIELIYAYQGVIEGEGVAQCLISQNKDDEVNFVALERVMGSIGGRSGSFVLQRIGTFDKGHVIETVTVIPGTGTGELITLSGQAAVEHTGHQEEFHITFEYQL